VFYIAAFACLAFLWISFIVGERIRTYLAVSEPPQDRLLTVFRVAFPSPLIWLAIICLGLYLTLSFLSRSIGNRWAVRDQSPESHLPIMTVISAEPLLIIKTDNTYYVLRPEEVRDGMVKTYGIPGDRVAEIQLYPWFDTIVHP